MGSLDDLGGPERTAQMTRLRMTIEAIPVLMSGPETPPHWACPDCGSPCYCIDPLARRMPHTPCKVVAA